MSEDTQLVHARYVGGTTVVMPDLVGRARCCDSTNHRSDDDEGRPNPHTLLEHGDVILLDRWSAENRDDFEVVDEPKPGRKTAARKPPKAAMSKAEPTAATHEEA